MAHGAFIWNELMTPDVEKAKAFYAASLGWTYDAMPSLGGSTYWIAKMDGRPVAGMISHADLPPGASTAWFAYIEVDDVDACAAALPVQGGALARPAFDIPGVGRIAIVQDATGAMVGWLTPVMPAPPAAG
jgi:predicted enzyme related to lactoylglutathione lyase